jgi:hypothetical protein
MDENEAARIELAGAAPALTIMLARRLEPSGDEFLVVRQALLRLLGTERDRRDADELVDAVLDRFTRRARSGAIAPAKAGDYLARSIAAAALTAALARGLEPPGEEYLVVRDALLGLLGTERDRSDADELVDGVLDRFMRRARDGGVIPAGAFDYLGRSVANARIDRQRAHVRHASVEIEEADSASEDDAIFRLIESDAARQGIYAALRDAFRQDDAAVIRVVLEWIRIAERRREPTLAEIGAAVGLSPQGVADALQRFRERYVAAVRSAGGS